MENRQRGTWNMTTLVENVLSSEYDARTEYVMRNEHEKMNMGYSEIQIHAQQKWDRPFIETNKETIFD